MGQTFANELGGQQPLFTASLQQVLRPEMFADVADVAFYKQFAQSGIARNLNAGLITELKDAGIDVKNTTVDLARSARDNPGAVARAVWDAVKSLPQSVVDGFKENGTALGEGAAVSLSKDLTDKLNAIYGTDVGGIQKAVLALRITASVTGAAGGAKAATGAADVAAAAIGAKLEKMLDQKALDALLKSGGVVDKEGVALLDMKSLSTQQKGQIGELFGENTVKQIVPDGQKIARMQGVGTTGIDDLYKVGRTDVDYVFIEYKFVGQDGKTGAQVLSKTQDGLQGSQSWLVGSGRIDSAVGADQAIDIFKSLRAGRTESWVVTTRPDGSNFVQVLDSAGKPKLTDTSKLILPSSNFSGATP